MFDQISKIKFRKLPICVTFTNFIKQTGCSLLLVSSIGWGLVSRNTSVFFTLSQKKNPLNPSWMCLNSNLPLWPKRIAFKFGIYFLCLNKICVSSCFKQKHLLNEFRCHVSEENTLFISYTCGIQWLDFGCLSNCFVSNVFGLTVIKSIFALIVLNVHFVYCLKVNGGSQMWRGLIFWCISLYNISRSKWLCGSVKLVFNLI